MQFFIALAVLAVASSAYLLHQFWTRSLSGEDLPAAEANPADADAQRRTLRAA